jgi:coenzyme F420-reducing hydrogenase delta subunit
MYWNSRSKSQSPCKYQFQSIFCVFVHKVIPVYSKGKIVVILITETKLNQSRKHMFIISVRDGSTYSKKVNCFNTIVKRVEPGFN